MSVIFVSPLSFGNKKYGTETGALIILNSRGLRVTIPPPRGRKLSPQIYSNNEDLPADYSPTTAIRGREIYSCKLKSRSLSTKDIIDRIF